VHVSGVHLPLVRKIQIVAGSWGTNRVPAQKK